MNSYTKNNLPFVSICIASYNRNDIVLESLSSVLNQIYPKKKFEILFIDNASTDKTIETVKKKFIKDIDSQHLKIIQLESNLGTSGTYNKAITHLDKKWDYILKLDIDIILDKNCLMEMINLTKKIKYHGMVGGKIFYYKEKNIIHAIGSDFSPFFAIAKGIGVNEIDHTKFNDIIEVDAVNGCVILIPKIIYKKIGWFDNDYFLYYDDHEIMFRALKKGFKNYYCPTAIAYHDTSTGSREKYANKTWLYYSTRGSLLFLFKNFHFFSLSFFVFFLGHNLKFIIGFFYIIYYSNKKKLYKNLTSYILGYYHGLKKVGGFYRLDSN